MRGRAADQPSTRGSRTPSGGPRAELYRRLLPGTAGRDKPTRSAASGHGGTRTRLSAVPFLRRESPLGVEATGDPGVRHPAVIDLPQDLGHDLREVQTVGLQHDRVVGGPHRSDGPAGVTPVALFDFDLELLGVRTLPSAGDLYGAAPGALLGAGRQIELEVRVG